jgi:hypothetical protein
MATQTFSIKQHDLLPDMVLTLLDNDEAVDLTDALSARLMMRNVVAGLVVDAPVAILDQTVEANVGKVRYSWAAGDTDLNGVFNSEVEVLWPDDKPQTFPGGGYFQVKVVNDLDD